MNFSQQWFTGLSLVIAPILVNVLWGVVEGSSADAGIYTFSAKGSRTYFHQIIPKL